MEKLISVITLVALLRAKLENSRVPLEDSSASEESFRQADLKERIVTAMKKAEALQSLMNVPDIATTSNKSENLCTSMSTEPVSLNLTERQIENLDEFNNCLRQSRLWHILPAGKVAPAKAVGLFDAQTGRIFPPITELRTFLDKNPFVHVRHLQGRKNLATLQSETLLLWNNEDSDHGYSPAEAKMVVKEGHWAELENWCLPKKEVFQSFATDSSNPFRQGKEFRIAMVNGVGQAYWHTAGGVCDVDAGVWSVDPHGKGSIFACNFHWEETSDVVLLTDLVNRDWKLVSPGGEVFPPKHSTSMKDLPIEELLATWVDEKQTLHAYSLDSVVLNPRDYWINMQLTELDYTPCRLPKLDASQLTDPEKGLWELWGETQATLKNHKCVARDPICDLQRQAVAIDFGTSSTVVAMDTISGARELLRIGVRDFYEPVHGKHFENPTVLECLDFTAFSSAWTAKAYRPGLDWNWMRAAHEAQASFRDNPGDTVILSSILTRLKQWALRSNENRRVRLTDRQGHEMELAPHVQRNPVRGQSLSVGVNDPFDPIELYAWYLGMAINWRGRGLFIKYYLSFPVKYPREVKDRVLASFRRGLQRSLPDTLIQHHPKVLNDFEVTDLATEPAAYAAAALPHLGVEPTERGVPYAVFDFGGGTSDFDYGLLRWATTSEEAKGYERVFEHLASEGDNHLGGENLLEHMVYESFKNNLPVLREKRIQFTQPIDAQSFPGSEAFLAPTQAAQTNTVMLAAKLRDFLEKDKADLAPQIKLELIDANGNKQVCELVLDSKALDALLAVRIRGGVEVFLMGLARLVSDLPTGAPIQILLAGNGSRSRHIKVLFDTKSDLWQELLAKTFGHGQDDWSGEVPYIVVHPPLPMDEAHPHAPTSKTGVALGLLRLVPGENTLLLNHLHEVNDGQAPFAWFAGRMRRGRFEPVIAPSVKYGEWHALGPLQQGVFNMYVSSSPRAHTGLMEGDIELKKSRLDFPAAPDGALVFARAVKPHQLELAAAPDIANLDGTAVMEFTLE